MAKITYMPHPDDSDTTVVDGITFNAYEPTEIDDPREGDAHAAANEKLTPEQIEAKHAHDRRVVLINKLGSNTWFTTGEIDAKRHDAWKKMRDSEKAHREAQAEFDKSQHEHARVAARAAGKPIDEVKTDIIGVEAGNLDLVRLHVKTTANMANDDEVRINEIVPNNLLGHPLDTARRHKIIVLDTDHIELQDTRYLKGYVSGGVVTNITASERLAKARGEQVEVAA